MLSNYGSGHTSTPTIVFTPSGTVTNYTALVGGTNYTTAQTISFYSGFGSGVVATCTIASGVVNAITLTNNSSGYLSPPIIVFNNNGSGIAGITISIGGTNYINAPTISFTEGDGTGATTTCTILYGVVNAITITANETGCTASLTVVFTPTNYQPQ